LKGEEHHMEVEHILIAILSVAAIAWLVAAELNSRRNIAANQKEPVSAAPKAEQKSEAQAGSRQVRA
jgi:hypothetical protein